MDFYDDVKQTAEMAGEKIGQFADIAKIKVKVLDIQSKLKALYEKLGKAVYFGNEDDLSAIVEEIDAKRGQIIDLENRLDELKNKKVCGDCGKSNVKDATYCNYCGSRL